MPAGDEGAGSGLPRRRFRDAGYHAKFRGMKGYNGVATLTLQKRERILHGLNEGPDNEDVRIIQTVVEGIPIINSYEPLRSALKNMRSSSPGLSVFATILKRTWTRKSQRSGLAI